MRLRVQQAPCTDKAPARRALRIRSDPRIPAGWLVGRPYFHDELDAYGTYADDANEALLDGKRAGEWTAVSPTEAAVVLKLAWCPRELAEAAGRGPPLIQCLTSMVTSTVLAGCGSVADQSGTWSE